MSCSSGAHKPLHDFATSSKITGTQINKNYTFPYNVYTILQCTKSMYCKMRGKICEQA